MGSHSLVAAIACRVLGGRRLAGPAGQGVFPDNLAGPALGIFARAAADRTLGRQPHILAAADLGFRGDLFRAFRERGCAVVDRAAQLYESRSLMKFAITVTIGVLAVQSQGWARLPARRVSGKRPFLVSVHLQRRDKGLLRDFHLAELAHPLLSGLLLVEQFALTAHVAAIALGGDVLA